MTEIYTDGSANFKTGAGGWAVYIPSLDVRLSAPAKSTTNNRMEIQAVIEAIKFVEDNDIEGPIKILSDSEYTVNSFNIYWRNWVQNDWVSSTGSQVKNQDLIKELIVHSENPKYIVEWVRGHDKSQGNIEADRLAYLAYSEQKEEDVLIALTKSISNVGNISIIYNKSGEEITSFKDLQGNIKDRLVFEAITEATLRNIKVVLTNNKKFLEFKLDAKRTGAYKQEWEGVRTAIAQDKIQFKELNEKLYPLAHINFEKAVKEFTTQFYKNKPDPVKSGMIKSSYFDRF